MDISRSELLRRDINAQLNFGFTEEDIICNLKTKGYSDNDILAEKDLFFAAQAQAKAIRKQGSVTEKMLLIVSLLCIARGIWGIFWGHSPHAILTLDAGIVSLMVHFQITRRIISFR